MKFDALTTIPDLHAVWSWAWANSFRFVYFCRACKSYHGTNQPAFGCEVCGSTDLTLWILRKTHYGPSYELAMRLEL